MIEFCQKWRHSHDNSRQHNPQNNGECEKIIIITLRECLVLDDSGSDSHIGDYTDKGDSNLRDGNDAKFFRCNESCQNHRDDDGYDDTGIFPDRRPHQSLGHLNF